MFAVEGDVCFFVEQIGVVVVLQDEEFLGQAQFAAFVAFSVGWGRADHLPFESGFWIDSGFPDEMREGSGIPLGFMAEGVFVGREACFEVV